MEAITKEQEKAIKRGYSEVANCNINSDDGSGLLYLKNYQDSGGW